MGARVIGSRGRRSCLGSMTRGVLPGGPAGLPRGRAAFSREVLVTTHAWLLLAVYGAVLVTLAIPMGRWIADVMEGRLAFARRIESALYRVAGVKADAEMGWLQYALA